MLIAGTLLPLTRKRTVFAPAEVAFGSSGRSECRRQSVESQALLQQLQAHRPQGRIPTLNLLEPLCLLIELLAGCLFGVEDWQQLESIAAIC